MAPKPRSGSTADIHAMEVWKEQMKQRLYCTCLNAGCSLSFLTLKSAQTHAKECAAKSKIFVQCPGCPAKFLTFSTVRQHQLKSKCNKPPDSRSQTTDEAPLHCQPPLQRLESSQATRDRIIKDSRRISDPPRRGRPLVNRSLTDDRHLKATSLGRGRRASSLRKGDGQPERDPASTHPSCPPYSADRAPRRSKMSGQEPLTQNSDISPPSQVQVKLEPPQATNSTASVACGACDATVQDFFVHSVMTHGCAARPKGESQDFSPTQIEDALRSAFKTFPIVKCYLCLSFQGSSFRSLRRHMISCQRNERRASANHKKGDLPVSGGKRYPAARPDDGEAPSAKKMALDDGNVTCGKCGQVFARKSAFNGHAARVHGGVARPEAEGLHDFTQEEIEKCLRSAFRECNRVPCYVCSTKTFTTLPGLKFHLKSCGKSQDEIDAQKIKCELCDYSTLAMSSLKLHMSTWHRPGDATDDPPAHADKQNVPATGRRRERQAASKAKENVSKLIRFYKAEGITEDSKREAEDEDYRSEHEGSFVKKNAAFHCSFCDQSHDQLDQIKQHLLQQHAIDVSKVSDEDDDDDDEDEADDNGREPHRNGQTGSVNSARPRPGPRHKPQQVTRHQEASFRAGSFHTNEFVDWHSTASDWLLLDETAARDYLPTLTRSLPVKTSMAFKTPKPMLPPQRIQRFQSCSDTSSATLFAGGPIWASSWCPDEDHEHRSVLALSADLDPEASHTCLFSPTAQLGLIQLWSYDHSGSLDFQLGIAHAYGRIRWLDWCPSIKASDANRCGEVEKRLPRLGLLAAACSDATVRIWTVPQASAFGAKFVQGRKVWTLIRPDDGSDFDGNISACIKVVWFQGRGHKVLAASFSDGFVALWNLATSSPFLRRSQFNFLPYKFFRAHQTGHLSSLDLGTAHLDEMPTTLVTGSSDRLVYVWDLSSTVVHLPVREYRRNLVTDVTWLRHRPCIVSAAQDDVNLINHTRSIAIEMASQDQIQAHPIVSQNSVIWSQAQCPWNGWIVSCSSAGEVILLRSVKPQVTRLDDKHLLKVNVYRISLGKMGPDDKISGCLDSYRKMDEQPDFVMEFIDLPISQLNQVNDKERNATKQPMTMNADDYQMYPVRSINTVSLHPDKKHHHLLFSGGQAGFGRVHHLPI